MHIDVITLFPQMLEAVTGYGTGRIAVEKKALSVRCHNPRDYATDNYRTVDDRPYGGGPGMVMMAEPLARCLDHLAVNNSGPLLYLSPQGERLNQKMVEQFAGKAQLKLLCGRYEGVDERLLQSRVDQEVSIGDYVMAGGEIPAMVMIEVIARLLPGVLGNTLSAEQDSFAGDLLDCPHYTRPKCFEGRKVPEVLLGGNHQLIEEWRRGQSLARTTQRRPDLMSGKQLDERDLHYPEQDDE